jgi:hypothetical protein
MLVSADDFRELVADARKERFGAKAGQGRYDETALMWMSTVVRFLGRVDRVR